MGGTGHPCQGPPSWGVMLERGRSPGWMGGVPSPRPLPHPQTPSLPFPAPRQQPAAFVLLLPGCGDAGRGLGSGHPARRVPGDRDQAAPEPRDAIPGIPELPARHPAGDKALPCARTAAGSCGGSRGGSDVAGPDLLPGSGGRQERHCPLGFPVMGSAGSARERASLGLGAGRGQG